MGYFGDRYNKILDEARTISGNPNVQVIAVSKKQPFNILMEAYQDGIHDFGENSIQEGLEKIQHFQNSLNKSELASIQFHHIGPLQKGNLRKLFGNFYSTQGVGSINSLNELIKRSMKENFKLEYFIQMNLTDEISKNGFSIRDFEMYLKNYSNQDTDRLRMKGLMTMGPSDGDPTITRQTFQLLRKLRDDSNTEWRLSMGMSGDYTIALEEGSDMIRIGSAIFGDRVYDK